MECNNSNRNRNRKWTQQPWFKVMSHNNQAAVGSIKSQQRICGPFQLKALRDFTPTLFQAGPTDKKNSTFHFLCGHWGNTWERTVNTDSVFECVQRTQCITFQDFKTRIIMREKTERRHIQKKILLNTGVVFLAQGRRGGYACSFCQIPRKTVRMFVWLSQTNRQWIIVNHCSASPGIITESWHIWDADITGSTPPTVKTLVWLQTHKRKMSSICKYYTRAQLKKHW